MLFGMQIDSKIPTCFRLAINSIWVQYGLRQLLMTWNKEVVQSLQMIVSYTNLENALW